MNNILETCPESCFYWEAKSRNRYDWYKNRRGRNKKIRNSKSAKPDRKEIERRIVEYSQLVKQGKPLPTLPEYKDLFDVEG